MLQNYYAYQWEYWQLYHKVTFDGPNRQIIINPGETNINVQTDVYSDWKEWIQLEDNAKYPQALRTTGGDPLTPDESQKTGRYYFLLNGWKLVAPEDLDLLDGLNIDGNLFSADGSDIFTTRQNEVLIRQTVSQLSTITELPVTASVSVSASIDPASSIATASYVQKVADPVQIASGQTIDTASYVGSIENVTTASYVQTVGDPVQLAGGQSVATASYVLDVETVATTSYVETVGSINTVTTASYVQTIGDPVTLEAGQIVTASLASNQIVSASLTDTQETMLMELYRMFGLDPTRPLVVTPEARTVGGEISQSIAKSGDQVTVQRS